MRNTKSRMTTKLAFRNSSGHLVAHTRLRCSVCFIFLCSYVIKLLWDFWTYFVLLFRQRRLGLQGTTKRLWQLGHFSSIFNSSFGKEEMSKARLLQSGHFIFCLCKKLLSFIYYKINRRKALKIKAIPNWYYCRECREQMFII